MLKTLPLNNRNKKKKQNENEMDKMEKGQSISVVDFVT